MYIFVSLSINSSEKHKNVNIKFSFLDIYIIRKIVEIDMSNKGFVVNFPRLLSLIRIIVQYEIMDNIVCVLLNSVSSHMFFRITLN